MKKGVLGSWFKEFATIVFTQTVQAFLLAIVLAIIVSSLAGVSSDNKDDGVAAAGLLAIVALSSFGKIELLIKNIFGVTSSFGDPGSMQAGRGITAGTVLAMRGAKRLTDNFSKVRDANRMINQGQLGAAAYSGGSGDKKLSTTDLDSSDNLNGNEDISDTAEKIQQQSFRLQTVNGVGELTQAIRELTRATNSANKNDAESKKEKYLDMINEGNNLKRSAIRENIGATIGGIGGAVVGLAQGDNVLETALTGAGAGDALGAASANRAAKKEEYNKNIKDLNDKIAKLREESVEEFNDNIKQLEIELNKTGYTASKNPVRKISVKGDYLKNNNPVTGDISKAKRENLKEIRRTLKNVQSDIDKNTTAGNQ